MLLSLFSRQVVSNSLQPHGLQHAKPPFPSSSPGVYINYVHWICDAIHLSHPLLPSSTSTFSISQHQGLFQWVSSSHQVAKVLEFQLQHQSFQWLTSFRIDSFDVLVVQRTLKSLLQHHSSKASILQCSAFFMVQLSHPYMTTGKTIVFD